MTMNKRKFTGIGGYLAIGLIAIGISFGISDYFSISKGIVLFLSLGIGMMYIWNNVFAVQQNTLIANYDEKISELENIIEQEAADIAEQEEVIREYERIFDGQLVELPCSCGDNIFKGLFSPSSENICVCDNCGNNYRVTIEYNSVLIAEPADNNAIYDKLKKINESH